MSSIVIISIGGQQPGLLFDLFFIYKFTVNQNILPPKQNNIFSMYSYKITSLAGVCMQKGAKPSQDASSNAGWENISRRIKIGRMIQEWRLYSVTSRGLARAVGSSNRRCARVGSIQMTSWRKRERAVRFHRRIYSSFQRDMLRIPKCEPLKCSSCTSCHSLDCPCVNPAKKSAARNIKNREPEYVSVV